MFETGGALLIGARVGETIRKQLFDIHIFENDRTLLIIGMMSSMIGSGIWQSLATFLKMPGKFSFCAQGLTKFSIWDTCHCRLTTWLFIDDKSGGDN